MKVGTNNSLKYCSSLKCVLNLACLQFVLMLLNLTLRPLVYQFTAYKANFYLSKTCCLCLDGGIQIFFFAANMHIISTYFKFCCNSLEIHGEMAVGLTEWTSNCPNSTSCMYAESEKKKKTWCSSTSETDVCPGIKWMWSECHLKKKKTDWILHPVFLQYLIKWDLKILVCAYSTQTSWATQWEGNVTCLWD